MRRRKVLGEIIGMIIDTFLPMHDKMAEADSVADPIELHVNGFGAFLLDSVIDNHFGACIISLYWCSRLRMFQFVKGGA